MATLSPFIKTIQSSQSSIQNNNNNNNNNEIKSTIGRLSLLSSDIEDDLGIIDLNNDKYNYINRNEYWLLNNNEYDCEKNLSYDIVLEWINSYKPIKSNDEYKKYFQINNNDNNLFVNGYNLTPVNGYNRFDYLTKSSVSRTATITKRRIDNNINDNNNDNTIRYGTITKGTISSPFFLRNNNNNNREINRTFDLNESRLEFYESPSKLTTATSSDDNNNNTPNNNRIINNDYRSINTNTITKTNRRIINVTFDKIVGNNNLRNNSQKQLECDTSESDSNYQNDLNFTSDDIIDEYGLSSDCGLTDNNDLNYSKQLNRTFEKNNIEQSSTNGIINTDDDNGQISDNSGRNYPTISRNNTRTLFLRREQSQGQILNHHNNNSMINRQPQSLKKQVYLVSSNDDLLNSDCSTSMKSSSTMSGGRSEPNLLDAQKRTVTTTTNGTRLSIYNGNNINNNLNQNQQLKSRLSQINNGGQKFQSRLIGPTLVPTTNNNNNRISRIARPITNGSNNNNNNIPTQSSLINIRNGCSGIRKGSTNTIIKSNNHNFGSMGSIRDQQLLQNHHQQQHQQQQSNQYQMPRSVSQIKHPSLWKQQGVIPTAKFRTTAANAKPKQRYG